MVVGRATSQAPGQRSDAPSAARAYRKTCTSSRLAQYVLRHAGKSHRSVPTHGTSLGGECRQPDAYLSLLTSGNPPDEYMELVSNKHRLFDDVDEALWKQDTPADLDFFWCQRLKVALVVETAEIYGHCAKSFRRGGVRQPECWLSVAQVPDLPAMYSCLWEEDEGALRQRLSESYEKDLAAD